jgi:[ribosomal protein S18]-alanine N-acetyltransferase
MALTYFKRYRMELRLDRVPLDKIAMPEGIRLLPWSHSLLQQHAAVKWASFRNEIDSHVFMCLSEKDGCKDLMREITSRSNFIPEATWLAIRTNEFNDSIQPCGTVQGLLTSPREGAIQNLGVHPDFRNLGIGKTLLMHALRGFQAAGCMFANLEVTVQNTAAIRLYERFGFRKVETLFKIADVQFA